MNDNIQKLGIPPVSCFLVKIASRCNLDCDYCYVYQHADQSWRTMPKFIGRKTIDDFIEKLSNYVLELSIKKILIILHGGEPLLYGSTKIASLVALFKHGLPECDVDFSIQTNGVLLTEEICQLFEKNNISVSLSIDGPEEIHNIHRPFRNGKKSFNETCYALEILQRYNNIFTGVISVIDVRFSAEEYFKFFAKYNIPSIDFLLPDANYLRLPPYKENSKNIYIEWLISAFDLWFNTYPQISIRTFESLLACLTGLESQTDAFGFGDVTLLCLETDGTYHDLDVLKVTEEGRSKLNGSVSDTGIVDILKSEKIQLHRNLLSKKGMSKKCLDCNVLDICGGGSVPHRFNHGFENPSIYCDELYALITHAKNKLHSVIQSERNGDYAVLKDTDIEIESYYLRSDGNKSFYDLLAVYQQYCANQIKTILHELKDKKLLSANIYDDFLSLSKKDFAYFGIKPSIRFYCEIAKSQFNGVKRKNLINNDINIQWNEIKNYLSNQYFTTSNLNINSDDPWLRLPFDGVIEFKNDIDGKYEELIKDALFVISEYHHELYKEICNISSSIQFIHDPTASPDKAVSFSDNIVPGCLYIACECSGRLISRNLAAEAIIHEHLHQKLYMLQNFVDLFLQDFPYVVSPWREELRPPSGLLHAIFVFVEVFAFWCFLFKNDKIQPDEIASATIDIGRIFEQLNIGFETLENTSLSSRGVQLKNVLSEKFQKEIENCHILF